MFLPPQVLWDQYHSISYPAAYVPKDAFDQKADFRASPTASYIFLRLNPQEVLRFF